MLAQCFGGSGASACFSAGRLHATSVTSASLVGAPVFNNNQPVLNSDATVTLSWAAPSVGVPTSYIVEASSAPGGPANLADFDTGSPSTTQVVPNVPAGIYYVRIRAIDASGVGAPSNEVQLIVTAATGGGSCPSAPRRLTVASQSGGTVTLSWQPPLAGAPTSYVVQAGSSPNGSNLANFDTNSTALTLTASSVPAGSYYVRVYARNSSCAAPTFLGPASNEILMTITATPSASCPSAPQSLTIASQSGGTVSLAWQPPLTGTPTSYVVQAGSSPNGSNLANIDTNSTAPTLTASNVGAGSYYIRIYARNNSCAPPTFLGPASNEILLTIGAAAPPPTPIPSGWSGQIACRKLIAGPSGYHHDETQTWIIGGPSQTVGPRTTYTALWSVQGAGGGPGTSWTMNSTAITDFTVTVVASTGIPIFDRTTDGIVVRGGYVGTPTSFDLSEIDFPAFAATSANATSVTGTYSRPTVGGDSPQQPGTSVGTLTCSWSLTLR